MFFHIWFLWQRETPGVVGQPVKQDRDPWTQARGYQSLAVSWSGWPSSPHSPRKADRTDSGPGFRDWIYDSPVL